MAVDSLLESVRQFWTASIAPTLEEYIRIPNQSPAFDPEWETNGHIHRACSLLADWAKAQDVKGLTLEVLCEPKRSPLIVIEVPGHEGTAETVLMYGHLDKQPPNEGWFEGLSPYVPIYRDGKLYGRGGADDGYAIFAAITAIRSLQMSGRPHGRIVILIESCEESGSPDLPHYIDMLASRIAPSLVVCLDSGCGNYDQLWLTTSLRGVVDGNLRVQILDSGIHSGDGSGTAPSSFRILRLLLDRLEDSTTGEVHKALQVAIPEDRVAQARTVAEALSDTVFTAVPFVSGGKPVSSDPTETILNRTWRPTLCVTGADGMPSPQNAGNVLRPFTEVRLSIRIPPTLNYAAACRTIHDILTKDPPYGAHVTYKFDEEDCSGWCSPALAPWLEAALETASAAHYGRKACYMGEGGTIPFMGMLGQKFPAAQFMIVGVLGPASNAHAPNEFLHIDMAQKLTCCVADVVAAHYRHFCGGA